MQKYFILFLFASVAFIQSCGGGSNQRKFNKKQKDDATSVETVPVSQQDISRQVQSFGTVKSQDVVQVTPQVSNRITHIYADLGDTVQQGQRLAKIYDATYQDQVQQARAQLGQSKAAFKRDSANYVRQKKLYNRDLISKSTLDEAEATYQSSKSQLQSNRSNLTQNQENLSNSIIRSPVYGVVLTRNVAQGDLASSGQVAFEIGNLTGYETRVYLPLEDWKRISVGQKVTFQLSNKEESTAVGRVARKSPRLDPSTGLGEVVIAFTQKGPSIYQGVLVKSIIHVATHKGALVIPRSALVENVQTLINPESNTIQTQRNYSVFVTQGDTLALKHDIKLGIEQGDKIEVVNGLQPNDHIVVTGQASLEDSTRIQVAQSNAFSDQSIPISDQPTGNQPTQNDSSASNSNQ